jgi:hypothetical protein
MSLKVYRAYKLKDPSQFWLLVKEFKEEGTKEFRKRITEIYHQLMRKLDTSSGVFQEKLKYWRENGRFPERAEFRARLDIVRDTLREEYQKSSTSSLRSSFDFDVSFAFREHEGEVYLIPYCDMSLQNVLDFLKKDDRLVDFWYTNQVEKPKKISKKDWESRRKVWERLTDEDLWNNVVVLEICNFPMWYLVDPWQEIALKNQGG